MHQSPIQIIIFKLNTLLIIIKLLLCLYITSQEKFLTLKILRLSLYFQSITAVFNSQRSINNIMKTQDSIVVDAVQKKKQVKIK